MSQQTLSIGLVAYGITPSLVMVRVPNERGRWLLTDRCVAEVDCPQCLSVAGEPCKAWANQYGRRRDRPPAGGERYGVGVHVARKHAAVDKLGRGYAYRLPHPKLRIPAEDLAAAQARLSDEPELEPGGFDVDVVVTPKDGFHGR